MGVNLPSSPSGSSPCNGGRNFELLSDPARAERVERAFLKMRTFDIETLLRA